MVTKVANLNGGFEVIEMAFQESDVNKISARGGLFDMLSQNRARVDKKHLSLSRLFTDLCKTKYTYMKKPLLSLFFVLPMAALAQVPNGGMETWTNGTPDQWSTSNIPTLSTPVTQTSNAHSGSSAVRLEVVSTVAGIFPGLISSTGTSGTGFAVTSNYSSFSFYYKANLLGGDEFNASIIISDFNTQPTAGGSNTYTANQSVYTQAVVPISVIAPNPVSAIIYFALSNSGTANVGSYVQIDDIAFGAAVGIEELIGDHSSLSSPTPNPASGIALVPFTLTRPTVADIRVFDLTGRQVQMVLNQQLAAGNYKAEVNADLLSAGVYTIVMQADGEVLQTKLVVR